MSYRLPYPLPTGYDPTGPFRNPGATNPLPAPADIPTPCWFGGGVPLYMTSTITFGSSADIVLQGAWTSPIFDMRPDIRGLVSNTVDNGTPGHVSAVPIWNPAAQLWVQFENPANAINGIRATTLSGFQVLAQEEVHVCDPNNITTVSTPEDVTAQFTTTGLSSILAWYPLGDGNPVRFYRLRLVFNILANFQPVGAEVIPTMTLRPAMY